MIKLEKHQVFSTDGKYIHRVGTDTYFKRGTTIKGDTADNFEEVDAIPAFTKSEYNAEVERLIAERYTTGQEIQFAREKDAAGQKYAEYLAFVDHCKGQAKINLENKTDGPEL